MTASKGPDLSLELPAPWGSPPTPILPRWYLERHATAALPQKLRGLLDPPQGELRVLADLADLWICRSDRLTKDEHHALINFIVGLNEPSHDLLVIPAGTPAERILRLPLKVRTLNCIRRALHANGLDPTEPITVGHLMAQINFGITSLIDVMCVGESAVDCGFFLAPAVPTNEIFSAPEAKTVASADPKAPVRRAASEGLAVVLAVAAEMGSSRSLAEVLEADLGELVSVLGLAEGFEKIALVDLID